MTCGTCESRAGCTTPCAPINEILWDENRVMERHSITMIKVLPQNNEVHMSAVRPAQLERAEATPFPWSGTDCRLTKTAVFVERFFHKTPCKELAERFGVEENTIVCMYAQAVEQLGRMVEALDARREGLKATRNGRFTEAQKFFLLVCVFGFNRVEVARMFKRHHDTVWKKVKRLEDRYAALFAGEK